MPPGKSEIVRHVVALVEGRLEPDAMAWLVGSFRRYIAAADITLQASLGVDVCANGLRLAVRRELFAQAIGEASNLLSAGTTAYARAHFLGRELRRLADESKRRRPGAPPIRPASDMESHLLRALRVHPSGPRTTSGLWPIVDRAIVQVGVLRDESARQTETMKTRGPEYEVQPPKISADGAEKRRAAGCLKPSE